MKEEKKDLWAQINENRNIIKWPPDKSLTIHDIEETFELIRKQDDERRERMDKEYTDIFKVTNEEIDEIIVQYGGIENVPSGLRARVKVAGMYQEWSIPMLKAWKDAVHDEWVKQNKK